MFRLVILKMKDNLLQICLILIYIITNKIKLTSNQILIFFFRCKLKSNIYFKIIIIGKIILVTELDGGLPNEIFGIEGLLYSAERSAILLL